MNTQQNDNQHNDRQHSGTKNNDKQQNDPYDDCTRHYDTKHRDSIMPGLGIKPAIFKFILICHFTTELQQFPWAGNTNWRERLSTVHLLLITRFGQLLLTLKTLFTFLQNEEVNCTEPSLQLVFLALSFSAYYFLWIKSEWVIIHKILNKFHTIVMCPDVP
jgi:hypothetical protein